MHNKFTKDDFDRLKRIEEINSKSFSRLKGYSSKSRKEEVLQLQRPVRNKMKGLQNALLKETYLDNRFDITVSRLNKQSTHTVKGHIRKQIWISLVDRYELVKRKNNNIKHFHLPQIQIFLQPKRLIIASIWLEGNYCKPNYKVKLLDYLKNHKLDDNYKIEIYDKNNGRKLISSTYNKVHGAVLQKVRKKRNLTIAIIRKMNISKVVRLKENIYSEILQELQELNESIFSPCFGYKPSKKDEHQNIGRDRYKRKSSTTDGILESLRKGIPPKSIAHRHNAIQNEIRKFLRNEYKEKAYVYKEKNYVDLSVEFKDNSKVILYEIKIDNSALKCIKNGFGQLLFYSLNQKLRKFNNIELVMVGLNKMKKEAKNFVQMIQEFLGENNFRYQVFDEKKKVLLPESKS